MKDEIKGGTFPVVVCYLDRGEQMITEKGSMVWQTPNFKMETSGGGLGKMFSKALPSSPSESAAPKQIPEPPKQED